MVFVKIVLVFLTSLYLLQAQEFDFVILIMSQGHEFHSKTAENLKNELISQQNLIENQAISYDVQLLHKDYSDINGAWTILPLLKKYLINHNSSKFLFICGENTYVNIPLFVKNLYKFDFSKELFIGSELFDEQPVIIHHYSFFENTTSFKYPDLSTGYLLSTKLIKRLAEDFSSKKSKIDFSIDSTYELSKFVWDEGKGVTLTTVDFLCDFDSINDNCATQCRSKYPKCISKELKNEQILFAVKTCNKYHDTRLKVVIDTWGKYAKRIKYFSDVENKDLNTIDIKVPNTERGHCAKFMAIMRRAYQEMHENKFEWLYICDDDTLLSVNLLRDFLSCYDASDSLFIGERYGYKTIESWGYDYITLGGGMAVSRAGLSDLVTNKNCNCPQPDSPDDMTLGLCLKSMPSTLVHSPLFHQARPDDYASRYLGNQRPITFHRHWNLDPYRVYDRWFKEFDLVEGAFAGKVKVEL